MPFSYVVYSEHRLVISTGSDRVTWEEIKDRQDQTKTDPDFNPEFNQIVDLRAVTGFDMTSDQARMLARRMIFSTTSQRAFVAASPACYSAGGFLWSCLSSAEADPENVPSPVQSHPHTDGSEKTEAAKKPGFADILTKEQHKAKGVCG